MPVMTLKNQIPRTTRHLPFWFKSLHKADCGGLTRQVMQKAKGLFDIKIPWGLSKFKPMWYKRGSRMNECHHWHHNMQSRSRWGSDVC